MRKSLLLAGLVSFAAAGSAAAQTQFIDLGGSFRAFDVSADGTTVYGIGAGGPSTYDVATGVITPLPGANTTNGGINANGTLAAGTADEAGTNLRTAARWDGTAWTTLGGIGGSSGTSQSTGYDISDDGSTVVGLAWVDAGTAHAFSWDTTSQMMVDLGALGGNSSRANGVNSTGSVVLGWDEGSTGARRPAQWINGVESLLGALDPMDPNAPGEANASSPDGSIIVGVSNNGDITGGPSREAFRWENGSMIGLGFLPVSGLPFQNRTIAYACTPDGNTIVGSAGDQFFTSTAAFIWTPGTGILDLAQLLTDKGATVNVTLQGAFGMSADGKVLCGLAGSGPFSTGWVAILDDGVNTYCTSKSGLLCGTPAISSTGESSATATSGFTISAGPAVSGRLGVLLYSDMGRANLPFPSGGHILCIAPTVRRGGPVDSGGTTPGNNCDGMFNLDMNQFASGNYAPGFATYNPAAYLSMPGQQVNCQWWGRDTQGTGSFMSDAIEYWVCP